MGGWVDELMDTRQRAMKTNREYVSRKVCPETMAPASRSGNQVKCNKACNILLHKEIGYIDGVTPTLTYGSIQVKKQRIRLWSGAESRVWVSDYCFPAPNHVLPLSLPYGCRKDTATLDFQAAYGSEELTFWQRWKTERTSRRWGWKEGASPCRDFPVPAGSPRGLGWIFSYHSYSPSFGQGNSHWQQRVVIYHKAQLSLLISLILGAQSASNVPSLPFSPWGENE